MKGDRSMNPWWLAVLTGIVLWCSPAVRADTLAVSETVPFFGPDGTNVTLTYDWNTANDSITNATATGGFSFVPGTVMFGAQNGIEGMLWKNPNGNCIQQDAEYVSGTNLEVLPQPHTYGVMMYEFCVQYSCAPFGEVSDFGAQVTVRDPVATPEPATMALSGSALFLLVAKTLKRRF